MKDPTSRFHWPRDGVAIRVPTRRVAGPGASCELIAFAGRTAEASRRHAWDALAGALPRGTRVVLLVAAEDVSFAHADVPALSGLRLREALPNLVEDKTVAEVGTLHVALGQRVGEGLARTLGVIDRHWLAAIQVHVARSGLRVDAIVPESLAIPLEPGAWSLGLVGDAGSRRCWLRTDAQQAISVPDDARSAAAIAAALVREGTRPARLDVHAARGDGDAFGDALAASLGVPATVHANDPFVAWLAGDGQGGAYGTPLSLLAFDAAASGVRGSPWRIAAVLAIALVAVQLAGMQWEWAGLRSEARALRDESSAMLTQAFPDTRVVLDAPLQMTRGLAGLRAAAGHSDPADFSLMMAAVARVFAPLPSNALRGAEYEAHALRLRFAPGTATATDERDRFVAAAAQEGYLLQFDTALNAAGEGQASFRAKPAGA